MESFFIQNIINSYLSEHVNNAKEKGLKINELKEGKWICQGKRYDEEGEEILNEKGDIYLLWYKNGLLHRENGPAVEYSNGKKEWYKNGELHREDGPAIEWKSGNKEWFKNGKLHRENGPAVEKKDGTKMWYKNGKIVKE